MRDTEIPKGERHPRTPNLITTVKPETSKLKDLTLKGTELNERNCKTTDKIRRPPLVKIKQMYEVEQSTYAKLKQPKRGLREKNIS